MFRYKTSESSIEEIDDILIYNKTDLFIITVQTGSSKALLFTYKIQTDSWGQTYELATKQATFVIRPSLTM